MSAYIIANVRVSNAEQYAEYRALSTLAMQAHDAHVCVRGGEHRVLEGDWAPDRVVVLKFSNMAQAQAFYDSSEYARARKAREGAAVMRMIVVEGAD
jgi:uncharacterized protein (DUF1330 family)